MSRKRAFSHHQRRGIKMSIKQPSNQNLYLHLNINDDTISCSAIVSQLTEQNLQNVCSSGDYYYYFSGFFFPLLVVLALFA